MIAASLTGAVMFIYCGRPIALNRRLPAAADPDPRLPPGGARLYAVEQVKRRF